jgi:hypothetical protein
MSEIPNLEDLLTAIATLTEHNTELLTQREEQYQAMAARDTATAKLVNELTAQLKDYQERENKIKSAIVAGTAKEVRLEVADLLNYYSNQLTQGVGGHVEQANIQLENTIGIAKTQITQLSKLSTEMKGTFDTNFSSLKLFSESFEEQNKSLANDANIALNSVRNQAKQGAEKYTKELSDKFAKALSWKIAGILSAVCLSILLMTLFLAWLLIPSKAEIQERQAKYDSIASAKVAHNVIKSPTDGEYYAIVRKKSCFISSTNNEQYCKFR